MATRATNYSLNLSSATVPVGAIMFPDGTIQSSAAASTDSSIIVNNTSGTKRINFIEGNGLITSRMNETVTVSMTQSNANTGGSAIAVYDEGNLLLEEATSLNFVGGGVATSKVGSAVTVTVPGGSSGNGISAPIVTTASTSPNVQTYAITGYTTNSPTNYLVFLDGILQRPDIDYTISLNHVNFPSPITKQYSLVILAYQLPVQAGAGTIIQDEGIVKNSSASTLNFVGPGVTVTSDNSVATITVSGGGINQGQIEIQRDGALYATAARALNFTGNNFTLTTGTNNTINIDVAAGTVVDGGGGGGSGITGITVSNNNAVLGATASVTTLKFAGLGIGASSTQLSNSMVQIDVPGTLIQNEGTPVGFVNTLNFVGRSINASIDSNGLATIDSTGVPNGESMRILSLTADSLTFPAGATQTFSTSLTSRGEYLVIKVNGVQKAIRLFDVS